jgi:glutaminase
MHEKKAFIKDTNINEVLEFYFQCCSIELTSKHMSIVAGTLANGGICPITQKDIFDPKTIKNCLSLMYSCGMYDFSGEFAFSVGLPAKSGVSGAIMIVVPNVLGLCVYSPRLDRFGNSVRGIAFANALIQKYNFHHYDSLIHTNNKVDPRGRISELSLSPVISLIWAASQGNLMEIQRIIALGVDINAADYDGRTALHLAASEGQLKVIEFLLKRHAKIDPIDRWGGTPLSEAKANNHQAIVALLIKHLD